MRRNEMTASVIDRSQRNAARVAGFAVLFAMAIVIFGEFYLSAKLVVPDNAADTARNILAHETRFRISIVCDLLDVVSVVVLLAALYVILKPVSRTLALVAAICRLIYASMWVVTALNMLGALRLLGGGTYLRVFETERLQALARLCLSARFRENHRLDPRRSVMPRLRSARVHSARFFLLPLRRLVGAFTLGAAVALMISIGGPVTLDAAAPTQQHPSSPRT